MLAMRNVPSLSVTVSVLKPVMELSSLILAPTRAAPVGSVTRPLIVPVWICPGPVARATEQYTKMAPRIAMRADGMRGRLGGLAQMVLIELERIAEYYAHTGRLRANPCRLG